MCVYPDLSPPKPLDQSKNVTAMTYHKFSEDKNGKKERKFGFQWRNPLKLKLNSDIPLTALQLILNFALQNTLFIHLSLRT